MIIYRPIQGQIPLTPTGVCVDFSHPGAEIELKYSAKLRNYTNLLVSNYRRARLPIGVDLHEKRSTFFA